MSLKLTLILQLLPFYRLLRTPAISVIVGTAGNKEIFFVHRGIICDRSKFFANAMGRAWRESEGKQVQLEEHDPATFALYQELLYKNVLPVKVFPNEEGGTEGEEAGCAAYEHNELSKLYVLADKLMDEQTKHHVLNALMSRSKKSGVIRRPTYCPGLEDVRIIYGGTPEFSPARAMLVDFYTDHGNESFLAERTDTIPKDFLYDISKSMLSKRLCQEFVHAQLSAKDMEIMKLTNLVKSKDREVRSAGSRTLYRRKIRRNAPHLLSLI